VKIAPHGNFLPVNFRPGRLFKERVHNGTPAPAATDRYLLSVGRSFNGPFPGLPGWAGTRKVKLIWILLKQETVSGSGISWTICKSAPRSRQITTPAPITQVFYRPDALPAAQPTASKHWRQIIIITSVDHFWLPNKLTPSATDQLLIMYGISQRRHFLCCSSCVQWVMRFLIWLMWTSFC